jgi:hypothetical protein
MYFLLTPEIQVLYAIISEGVLGVVMALQVTTSIASSGIYKKKELMNNFYNDKVRCK